MDYDKDDVSELYKSLGITHYSYIEIKEIEELKEIIDKWSLIKEITSFDFFHEDKRK